MALIGSTEEMSLSDLIQVASANRRTMRIRLRAGSCTGVLFLEDGALVDARFGQMIGNEAVYAALSVPDVSYEVDPGVMPPGHSVSGSTAHLLLEAARRVDEGVVALPRTAMTSGPIRTFTRRRRGWRIAAGAGAIAVIAAAAVVILAPGPDRDRGVATASAPPVAKAAAEAGPAVEAAELTGPGDVAPTLMAGAPPHRPAVDLALAPTIVCRLLIGIDGQVADAQVYRSRLDLATFEDAALDAARRYRFNPARKNGAPVAAWVRWPVSFAGAPSAREELRIKGSDTIGGALAPALAEAFRVRHPDVTITIEALGSSTAFAGLLDGSADMGASSRPVDARELADAARLGVTFDELVIGYDGLAVLVHPSNPVRSVTLDEVARLFTGEIANWKELGGADAPVRLLGRPRSSGTHTFFRDKVVRRGDSHRSEDFAATIEVREHSSDLAVAVAADPRAVTYAGLGWVRPDTRALSISLGRGQPAVVPEAATVRDGRYPVYRPLLMYTRGHPRGAAAAFLRFVLSAEGQAIVAGKGFVASDVPVDAVVEATDGAPSVPAAPVARISFSTGSASLTGQARSTLVALAHDAGTQRLLVIGHADSEGGAASTREVSRLRAEAVAAYLGRLGVVRERLTVEAAGDERPLETNGTRAGRSRNRRVEVFRLPP